MENMCIVGWFEDLSIVDFRWFCEAVVQEIYDLLSAPAMKGWVFNNSLYPLFVLYSSPG